MGGIVAWKVALAGGSIIWLHVILHQDGTVPIPREFTVKGGCRKTKMK